jgi:hypothetical protein
MYLQLLAADSQDPMTQNLGMGTTFWNNIQK